MMERLKLFNQEQAAEGKVQIKIGIGIATGEGVAGYIGTLTRTNYTWISSASNLAARLDAYTKQIGKPILTTEKTRLALGDEIQVQDEGWVDIRGLVQKVHIFSILVDQ